MICWSIIPCCCQHPIQGSKVSIYRSISRRSRGVKTLLRSICQSFLTGDRVWLHMEYIRGAQSLLVWQSSQILVHIGGNGEARQAKMFQLYGLHIFITMYLVCEHQVHAFPGNSTLFQVSLSILLLKAAVGAMYYWGKGLAIKTIWGMITAQRLFSACKNIDRIA